MEAPDLNPGAVRKLVNVLRTITRFVQIVPFGYLLAMAIYLGIEQFLPEDVALMADNDLYINPWVPVVMLILSDMLELCAWHKTACLIPFVPQIFSQIDIHLFTFTQEEVVAFNSLMCIATFAFLFAANRHFFHVRKKHTA